MKTMLFFVTAVALMFPLTAAFASSHAKTVTHRAQINHGRYLIKVAGCNDCHTPGWSRTSGHVAENKWLTGAGEVFVGPWGTTYPVNLRLFMQKLTLKQWVHAARTMKTRPPMPWYDLHAMTNKDLAAIYYFVRSLGSAGKVAHRDLPPGQLPPAPYMQVVLPTKLSR